MAATVRKVKRLGRLPVLWNKKGRKGEREGKREPNCMERMLDFYGVKKLTAIHMFSGQCSNLSMKSYFKGSDVSLKMVSQVCLIIYPTPKNITGTTGSSSQKSDRK